MPRSSRAGRLPALTLVVLAASAGSAGTLRAQLLKVPTLVFEPGVVTVNAVSAPLRTGSSTGLNLRFLTVVPTAVPWLSLELGTTFAPLGLSNGQRALNEPTFFYGPVAMLLPRDRTGNWVEVTLPVLGAYRLDETGEEERLYVNDLVVQGVLRVSLGRHLLADMGQFWSRLTIYALAEQNLTPGRNFATRRVDRFNPAFQYGVSIPLGRAADTQTPP